MASAFNHTLPNLIAGTTRTLCYGPVPTATTVVVFAGTLANIDNTNQIQHSVTLESYNGTDYTTFFNNLPVPYGSTSKVPKIVLLPGESLYVKADAANSVACRFELLIRT